MKPKRAHALRMCQHAKWIDDCLTKAILYTITYFRSLGGRPTKEIVISPVKTNLSGGWLEGGELGKSSLANHQAQLALNAELSKTRNAWTVKYPGTFINWLSFHSWRKNNCVDESYLCNCRFDSYFIYGCFHISLSSLKIILYYINCKRNDVNFVKTAVGILQGIF